MAESESRMPEDLKHPYFPWDLKIPNYVENKLPAPVLLGVAGMFASIAVITAWVITGKRNDPFCILRRLTLCWFMLCAVTHVVLEGYFAIYHSSFAGHRTILGQMCK